MAGGAKESHHLVAKIVCADQLGAAKKTQNWPGQTLGGLAPATGSLDVQHLLDFFSQEPPPSPRKKLGATCSDSFFGGAESFVEKRQILEPLQRLRSAEGIVGDRLREGLARPLFPVTHRKCDEIVHLLGGQLPEKKGGEERRRHLAIVEPLGDAQGLGQKIAFRHPADGIFPKR